VVVRGQHGGWPHECWSCPIIPAVIYLAVTVRVTAIEDRMLRDELAGYADYAAKVHYRLIPGMW
jgi:protein-S-isoprenylcysteine O-methyltransferase Ste14